MTLTADQIKAATGDAVARAKKRLVPEWGGEVLIKSWTGRERVAFWEWTKELKEARMPDTELWAQICVRGLVDDKGEYLFNGEGVSILMDRDAGIVKELADEIIEHNGLDKNAQARAEKNLTPASEEPGIVSQAI